MMLETELDCSPGKPGWVPVTEMVEILEMWVP